MMWEPQREHASLDDDLILKIGTRNYKVTSDEETFTLFIYSYLGFFDSNTNIRNKYPVREPIIHNCSYKAYHLEMTVK